MLLQKNKSLSNFTKLAKSLLLVCLLKTTSVNADPGPNSTINKINTNNIGSTSRSYFLKDNIIIKRSQIQKKYNKLSKIFGVEGKLSQENCDLLEKKVMNHINNSSTKIKKGIYKQGYPVFGIPVFHYYSEKSRVNVIVSQNRNAFLTCKKLTDDQLNNIKTNGFLKLKSK